jgi:hypothetical protein
MWKATARMMMAHPWTGVGAGAWEVQIPLYQRSDVGMEVDYYAHNEYLQLLSEYGLVTGGLFLAVLFAYLLVSAGKTWRLLGNELVDAPLRALTLASLLALLIVSGAGFPLRLASSGALFALSLAILAASDTGLGTTKHWVAAVPIKRLSINLILAVLIGCTLLTAYITHRAIEAERRIVSAIHLGFGLTQPLPPSGAAYETQKKLLLQYIREGVALNSHYRKLTPSVASLLVAMDDWSNAVWVWESVIASRPNIAEIWSLLARGYTQLGQYERALVALHQWQRVHPDAPGSRALEVALLNQMGHEGQATKLLLTAYDKGTYDFALVQTGYAMGLKTHNWPVAIRSLQLRSQAWPAYAVDGYFRLGLLYSNPEVNEAAKALEAFRAGLAMIPSEERAGFISQVPEPYRMKLQ